MAWYFMDTSALAKRYLNTEAGASRVRSLCRTSAGHEIAIARITTVEIASAFNRLRRMGQLDDLSVGRMLRLFRRHYNDDYRVVQVDDRIYEHALQLVLRRPLRALDAIQLACALDIRSMAGVTTDFRFCTADRNQAAAADRESLNVELIA